MNGSYAGNFVVRFLRNVIGPAAIIAAGMIGAGAVSTRLLAGAWFGFDLLWVALYVIPMVIFTVDSASRIGIFSGHRGMLDLVKTDIHPGLAWFFFIPIFLLNIVISMSQMSVMIEATYGALGIDLPADGAVTLGLLATMAVLTAISVALVVTEGYKGIEKIMTGLLLFILICFIIVAVKGLMDWHTWKGLAMGLVPRIPDNVQVLGSDRVRDGFTQLMAIAGQALPSAVFLAYGYFTSNAEYSENDLKMNFRKTVINLGVIWGLFSIVVVVAGTTALHNVYSGAAVIAGTITNFSQIENVTDAGKVITPALPSAISYLAPRIFSLGLFGAAFTTLVTVAMTMCYFTLDMFGMDWKYHTGNRPFRWLMVFWIVVPAVLCVFWNLPSLLKAILAMVGNLVPTPISVGIIIYFINKKSLMGRFAAGIGRNVVLGITFVFSLYVLVYGVIRTF